MRVTSIPIGAIGFLSVQNHSPLFSRAYYHLTMVEATVFPVIGFLSSYDMCQSYVYNEPCKNIFMTNGGFNALRFAYLFYVAYIAKSYYRRIERGELILVTHGKSIVELINTIQNQQKKNDIELVAVKGVAVADGQVIAPGGQIEDIELPG